MTMFKPLPIQRGVSFGFYARNGYFSSPQARVEVDRMKELGVDWVCLIVMVMQETYASGRQFRDFKMTPADDELRDIIDYIHEKGMRVQLRPMLECWDGTQRGQIWFPHNFEVIPGKPVRHCQHWFESMTDRTLHYAGLASRAGCEMYGLDSEIDRITNYDDEWKQVIAAARSRFAGHVTSSHTIYVDFITELTERPNHWFKDLDSLGTSFYAPASDTPGSSLEVMRSHLKPHLEKMRKIAALYGKPFYFGEIGCCSTAGATVLPYGWNNPGGYDGEEQARYLDAVLDTFWNEPWWSGMYWWKWEEQNYRPQFHDDPRGDKGFTLWGKPAAAVMRKWFEREDRR